MHRDNCSLRVSFLILKKHTKSIVLFLVMIVLAAVLSFMVVFNDHIDYVDNHIRNNIAKYKEIDKEQLCKIANCTKIVSDYSNKIYKFNPSGTTKLIEGDYKFVNIIGKLYLTNNHELAIYNIESNLYYILNTNKVLKEYLTLIIIFVPFSVLMYIWTLMLSIKGEKEEAILINAGSEALLVNKSMISVTENIHHELNTPLEIIDNKIEKIHKQLSKYILEEDEAIRNTDKTPEDKSHRSKKLAKLNSDFEFIKTSSEQIYAVLEKMRGFKHLRYSNGNKTFGDIIEGCFKIINISNSNFSYKIDERLYDYTIGSNLKNAELLSIMINHIKNSLEADASKVHVLFYKYFTDGLLFFRIIDNGNGIPADVLKNIFKANFSTKKSDTGIRGNGMYLNKHIINSSGGDIRVISSANKGTTIEIRTPAKKIT